MDDRFNHQYNNQPSSSCFGFCTDGSGIRSNQRPLTHHHHQQILPQHEEDGDGLLLTSEDQEKKQEMDNLIAQAMNGLSFKERQEQQEILHGVEETVAEEATAIDRALQDLDLALQSRNNTSKHSSMYNIAESMDPKYVHARAFRLMFLRANEYDPGAAADQMIRFFELKNQLFGPEKLVKDITIDDLDEDDMDCLKAGWLQHVGKDRSGREVFIYIGCLLGDSKSFKTIPNYLRAQYFVTMRALRSEETQLRGTISIWYVIGNCKSKSKGRGYVEGFKAARALPQKKAAIHLFVDDFYQYVLCNAVIKIMKGNMRARMRPHFGSHMECQYKLSTYGVPSELLPVDANGILNLDRHLQWVRSCSNKDDNATFGHSLSLKVSEERDSNNSTLKSKDVLFTGGKVNYNEGNQHFLALVQDHLQTYTSGSSSSKRALVDQIIGMVHESGGRFLRQKVGSTADGGISNEDDVWEKVPLEELRKKVAQSFRNRRRRRKIMQSDRK